MAAIKTSLSFPILLFLLLQISGVAVRFQWSCPERKAIHFSPEYSPGVRNQPASPQLGLLE